MLVIILFNIIFYYNILMKKVTSLIASIDYLSIFNFYYNLNFRILFWLFVFYLIKKSQIYLFFSNGDLVVSIIKSSYIFFLFFLWFSYIGDYSDLSVDWVKYFYLFYFSIESSVVNFLNLTPFFKFGLIYLFHTIFFFF